MNLKVSGHLKPGRIIFNLVFWIGAFTYILAVRYYEIGSIAFLNLPIEIRPYKIYLNGLILGAPVGFFYSLVESRLDSIRLYDNSFLKIILLRTLYLFLVCGATMAFVAWLNFLLDVRNQTIDPAEVSALNYIFSDTVRLLLLGALIGNLFLSVFHTLRSKIGYQDFNNLLLGKY